MAGPGSEGNVNDSSDQDEARRDWDIRSVADLLSLLADTASDHSLLLIHFYWEGCPLCGGGTVFTKALDRLTRHYGFRRADIAWRGSFWDQSTQTSHYDYRAPVELPYKICWEMLHAKTQRYNGKQHVEAYPIPPWDRVHFPQLFFIDGKSIDVGEINKLALWNNEPTDLNPPSPPGLFNEQWEVVLFDESDAIDPWLKQKTLQQCLGDGLLLQLVNQHLDTHGDDQHPNIPALEEMVRCVVEQRPHAPQFPETCVRFQRSPVWPPH